MSAIVMCSQYSAASFVLPVGTILWGTRLARIELRPGRDLRKIGGDRLTWNLSFARNRSASPERAGQEYGKNGPALARSGAAAHAKHSMVLLHGVLDE